MLKLESAFFYKIGFSIFFFISFVLMFFFSYQIIVCLFRILVVSDADIEQILETFLNIKSVSDTWFMTITIQAPK